MPAPGLMRGSSKYPHALQTLVSLESSQVEVLSFQGARIQHHGQRYPNLHGKDPLCLMDKGLAILWWFAPRYHHQCHWARP